MDLPKVRQVAEPILAGLGLELIDVQFLVDQGRPVLRVLMDKPGGVTVEDCRRISREIDTVLEVEGVVTGRYFLEVSSPGLDRPLLKEADFVNYVGKVAAVKTREPIEGRRNYKGLLKGVEEGRIRIEIDGQDFLVPLELVEKAKLVY